MNTLSLYQHLFREPSPADKLKLFQTLFDSNEINPDLALALLKIVHSELSSEEGDGPSYRQYAQIIEAVRYHKMDMLRHIVETWKAGKPAKDPEWLTDGKIK